MQAVPVTPSVAGEELAVHADGTRILVRAPDASLLAVARLCLPPGATLRPVARPHVVYDIRRARSASGSPDGVSLRIAVHDLASDLEFRVALHAPGRIFVHAAAVAWEGRVISLPGRSFAGKSTLAAALVRAGAQYLSDEFTVLDADGLVHPFLRPLHLRSADGTSLCHIRPAELGAVRTTPTPLGMVLRASFRAGAHWSPRPMSRGETVLALLDNAVAARLRPAAALRYITRAVRPAEVPGFRGRRGEAAEVVEWLLARTDRPAEAS